MTARDAGVRLDWSRHRVNATPKTCRICGGPALMTDAGGLPCHKVCGDAEPARSTEYYAAGGTG